MGIEKKFKAKFKDGLRSILPILLLLPINPLVKNRSNFSIRRPGFYGALRTGYDLNKNGRLDIAESQFYFGNKESPYFTIIHSDISPEFKKLQEEYQNRI